MSDWLSLVSISVSTSGPLDVGALSQPQLSAIDPPDQSNATQRPHSELQPSSKTPGAEGPPGAGEGITAVTTEVVLWLVVTMFACFTAD